MDGLMISIFILLGCLIGFFIAYSTTTSRIIKDQEKEIAKLRTSNMRLQAALRGRKYVGKVKLSGKPTNAPQAVVEIVKPDFKEW